MAQNKKRRRRRRMRKRTRNRLILAGGILVVLFILYLLIHFIVGLFSSPEQKITQAQHQKQKQVKKQLFPLWVLEIT